LWKVPKRYFNVHNKLFVLTLRFSRRVDTISNESNTLYINITLFVFLMVLGFDLNNIKHVQIHHKIPLGQKYTLMTVPTATPNRVRHLQFYELLSQDLFHQIFLAHIADSFMRVCWVTYQVNSCKWRNEFKCISYTRSIGWILFVNNQFMFTPMA